MAASLNGNLLGALWKALPKGSLVILLLLGLAWNAHGGEGDLGDTKTPIAEKAPSVSAPVPGSYRLRHATSVYREPQQGSQPIATLKAGTRVHVVNIRGDWLEIRSEHGRPPGFIEREAVALVRERSGGALHRAPARVRERLPGERQGKKKPKIRITSPKDGSRIVQEQDTILVSGKVSTPDVATPNVDLLFILDVSASTARYAGVNFGDTDIPVGSGRGGRAGGQFMIYGGGFGLGEPVMVDLRNSILGAEVAATRRLLSQLNPQTTRVGLITFGEKASLLQPLTRNFEQVKRALEDVLAVGPYGGTHMVGGIRLGIRELSGLGLSKRRRGATKVNILLTDGFPTLPIGGGRRATPEDANLAINAARIARKAGIKIHVFALGEEALSAPRAAVGIARQSGGIFTPVVRPADILAVLDNVSLVGVEQIEVVNTTTGKKSSNLRLAPDGFFSSSVPVVEGLNRIDVIARVSGGSVGEDSITVQYQRGGQRSLDLEVFLEKERNLKLEVKRLGRSREEIQREIDRSRDETLGQSSKLSVPVHRE